MLANFFGKSKPVNFLVIFTLFLIYFSLSLFSKTFSLEIFKELFYFIVVFSVYNFIIAKNNLTFDNSYAFLFFVILIGFFIDSITINKTFLGSLTVLLFSRKVYSLRSSKNTFHKLFDGGLWLGISFIIEPYTVIFSLLLYVSIYLHVNFTYQTLLISLIGFLAPVFLFFTYCFWYNNTTEFLPLFYWNYSCDINSFLNYKYLVAFVFIGVFLITSLFLKTPKALAVLNSFRKNWILTCIHLIVSLIIVLLIDNKNGSELLFVFFPISVILANGIELIQKNWIINFLIIAYIVGSLIIHFI